MDTEMTTYKNETKEVSAQEKSNYDDTLRKLQGLKLRTKRRRLRTKFDMMRYKKMFINTMRERELIIRVEKHQDEIIKRNINLLESIPEE